MLLINKKFVNQILINEGTIVTFCFGICESSCMNLKFEYPSNYRQCLTWAVNIYPSIIFNVRKGYEKREFVFKSENKWSDLSQLTAKYFGFIKIYK